MRLALVVGVWLAASTAAAQEPELGVDADAEPSEEEPALGADGGAEPSEEEPALGADAEPSEEEPALGAEAEPSEEEPALGADAEPSEEEPALGAEAGADAGAGAGAEADAGADTEADAGADTDRAPNPGPSDALVAAWITFASGIAVGVAGGVILAFGVDELNQVENARSGTRWSTVEDAYERAPVFTGAGAAVLGVGAATVVVSAILLAVLGERGTWIEALRTPGGAGFSARF